MTAKTNLNTIREQLTKTESIGQNKGQTKIDIAIDFLKSAAEFERAQEIKFFTNFKNQYPDTDKTFNLNLSDTENIDINLIIAINQALKGAQAFSKELNTEISRIKRRRSADEVKKNTDEYWRRLNNNGEQIDASSRKDYYLTIDGKSTFNSIISTQPERFSELTSFIIEKFGAKLFTFSKNNLKLNPGQISSLIKVIIDKAYELLIIEYGKFVSNNEDKRKENSKAIAYSKELENFVNNLLDTPNLGEALSSIASQHGIKNDKIDQLTKNARAIEELKNKLKLSYNNSIEKNTMDFDTWRKKNGMSDDELDKIVRAINTVSAQAYYTGEDLGLTELLVNHIGAVLGGNANPTDDIQAGKLIIDINVSKDQSQINNLRNYEERLLQAQAKQFAKVNKTTTLQSFQSNTEALRQLRQEQNEILNELKEIIQNSQEGLNFLLEHINIHTTIKGYVSAGRDNFEYYGGFEGAAFGVNLIEQLNIISDVMDSGGLSLADLNFLYQAMINAGSGMIGNKNKRTLENYFSAFIGFLMFNDAALFTEDIQNFINGTFTTDSQDIHLYQLNGIYIPSSYLLQKTWESLNQLPRDLDQKTTNQGTRAILHTYDKGPIKGNFPENWEQTSTLAQENTKLEMKFLAGFFDLLDQISQKLPIS